MSPITTAEKATWNAEVEAARLRVQREQLQAAKSALMTAASIALDREQARSLVHLWAEVDRELETLR